MAAGGNCCVQGWTGAAAWRWGSSLRPGKKGRQIGSPAGRLLQAKGGVSHRHIIWGGEKPGLYQSGRWESPKTVHFCTLG